MTDQRESPVNCLGDLMIAGVLIVVTLPLMGIVALAIKCDSPGPVFHRKERVRLRGRPFFALRFRTTAHDGALDTRSVKATEPDGRLTRVGWFLRYTRMERLPQLINVVCGDMSVIRASPERPHFLD
jgi:lipopolysaccharide/colanic/teichoic acid biosynthesis glycosyltransferase